MPIFAFIKSLSSIVTLVIGLAGGGTLIGGLSWAYNVFVDNPKIIAVEEAKAKAAVQIALDAAAIRVMDAANRAEQAERARQKGILDAAYAAFKKVTDLQDQMIATTQDQYDKEIADHEKDLKDAGRSSPLTDADFDWLRNQRHKSPVR
jgi:threonine dehydratase